MDKQTKQQRSKDMDRQIDKCADGQTDKWIIHTCTDGQTYKRDRMDRWLDGRTDGWSDGQMDG